MAVKIRLARWGSKKRPFYRIVIAEVEAPRDGRFIEKVGTYNPMLPKEDTKRITLEVERLKYWISVGAQPTDRVARFLGEAGLIAMPKPHNNPIKAQPKKKTQERMKADAERQEQMKNDKKAEIEPAVPAPVAAPESSVEPVPAPEAAPEESVAPVAAAEPTAEPVVAPEPSVEPVVAPESVPEESVAPITVAEPTIESTPEESTVSEKTEA